MSWSPRQKIWVENNTGYEWFCIDDRGLIELVSCAGVEDWQLGAVHCIQNPRISACVRYVAVIALKHCNHSNQQYTVYIQNIIMKYECVNSSFVLNQHTYWPLSLCLSIKPPSYKLLDHAGMILWRWKYFWPEYKGLAWVQDFCRSLTLHLPVQVVWYSDVGTWAWTSLWAWY